MEGKNRLRVFYCTEKREGESLEIYARAISPCSSCRVSDLYHVSGTVFLSVQAALSGGF
jgi:hypothetical protein